MYFDEPLAIPSCIIIILLIAGGFDLCQLGSNAMSPPLSCQLKKQVSDSSNREQSREQVKEIMKHNKHTRTHMRLYQYYRVMQ